jgi:cell fate (sporulation/competence/biofilm development) regulator YmcA (YheA/YmcA/DUF963 family)
MHESSQKMQNFQPRASQIDKIQTKNATHVQMSKLGTLRLRIDLNHMITKFHNHWTKLKWILAILRKNMPLMSNVLNMIKAYQNGKATQTSC